MFVVAETLDASGWNEYASGKFRRDFFEARVEECSSHYEGEATATIDLYRARRVEVIQGTREEMLEHFATVKIPSKSRRDPVYIGKAIEASIRKFWAEESAPRLF